MYFQPQGNLSGFLQVTANSNIFQTQVLDPVKMKFQVLHFVKSSHIFNYGKSPTYFSISIDATVGFLSTLSLIVSCFFSMPWSFVVLP